MLTDLNSQDQRRLRITNVTIETESLALAPMSLEVDAASMACIVGPNGAGKSVLLSTLAGNVEPVDGSLEYVGFSASDIFYSAECLEEVRGRESVREHLHRVSDRPHRIDGLLRSIRSFGLAPGKALDQLSPGERQKLVVLRGRLSSAFLFLFDSPTLGVDTEGHDQVLQALRLIVRRGAAVVVATGDADLLLKLCEASIHSLTDGQLHLVRPSVPWS